MNTQANAVPGSFEAQIPPPAVFSATRPFYWSVRRELWEYRSIYIAPLAAAALFLIGFLISTIRMPRQMRTLSSICTLRPAPDHPYALRLRRWSAHAHRDGRRPLLLPRRAARRTPRSQHPLLEVAARLRHHRSARQGEHPARGPPADHLRPHRCHAVDHPARQQRDMAGERPERRHALDTGRNPAHVTGDLLPPAHCPRALACAVLWMAVAGLGVGTARCISMGRAAGNRHRFRREDRLQHLALCHLPGRPLGRRCARGGDSGRQHADPSRNPHHAGHGTSALQVCGSGWHSPRYVSPQRYSCAGNAARSDCQTALLLRPPAALALFPASATIQTTQSPPPARPPPPGGSDGRSP